MEAAQFVRDIKTEVRLQMAAAEDHQAQRPLAHEPCRPPTYTYAVEIELVKKLKRIHDYSSQMTKYVIPKGKPDSQKAMTRAR